MSRQWRGRTALMLVLVAMVLLAGCGAAPDGRAAAAPAPEGLSFVIPAGTAAARMAGAAAFTIPKQMEITAGQSITVRNEDQAMHYFFFAPIAPGQSYRKVFSDPGQFGYSGLNSCSVGEIDSVMVTVKPRGAGR